MGSQAGRYVVIGSTPFKKNHENRPIWKGSHNPIFRGQNRPPWELGGMILLIIGTNNDPLLLLLIAFSILCISARKFGVSSVFYLSKHRRCWRLDASDHQEHKASSKKRCQNLQVLGGPGKGRPSVLIETWKVAERIAPCYLDVLVWCLEKPSKNIP